MRNPTRARPAWLGFLIGFLAIALPMAGFLAWKQTRGRPSRSTVALPVDRVAPPKATMPVESIQIDETGLRVSGASMEDPTPPPSAAALRTACQRARAWLTTFRVDPFGGSGTDSLRLFALEVECWDRLAVAEAAGPQRDALSAEVRSRLKRVLDARLLRSRLGHAGSPQGLLEAMQMAARCRDYGLDPDPLVQTIASLRPILSAEIDRSPPSIAAMYGASMARIGLAPEGLSLARPALPTVVARPREVTMGLPQVLGLTSEIFAATNGARRPLDEVAPPERAWLQRVLPHLALSMILFHRNESAADLLSCLVAAGMTDTYGYREGMRRLIERQNVDGSFGDASATTRRGRVIELLAPTTAAITAITLERARIREVG